MTEQTTTPAFTTELQRRRAAAALDTVKAEVARDRKLADILGFGHSHRRAVGHVIEVEPFDNEKGVEASGSYVVEIVDFRPPSPEFATAWAAVHEGNDDRIRYFGRDAALLAVIARRAGSEGGKTTEEAAFYAARVLGFEDKAES